MPENIQDWVPENHISRREERRKRLEKVRAAIEQRYEAEKAAQFHLRSNKMITSSMSGRAPLPPN